MIQSKAQFENIRFERFSAETGIPPCNVEKIIEDQYGYLWFATCEGLFYFDGYEFKAFRHDITDSTSIADPHIHTVYEDKSGNIWAGTAHGLSLLERRTGKFQTFKPFPEDKKTKVSNHVRFIFEDSKGRLWVNSNRNLLRFDVEKKQFISLYQKDKPDRTHYIRGISEDRKGNIWAGTPHGLLKVINDSTFQFLLPVADQNSPFNRIIRQILPEEDGTLLLATLGGLLKWNPETEKVIENFLPQELKNLQIDFITKDRKGNYWISFYQKGIGVYEAETQKFHRYLHNPNELKSLPSDEVSYILEDRFKNVWIGTSKGISKVKIDHSGFVLHQNHVGFEHIRNQTNRVLKAKDGTIWSITPKGVFALRKGATKSENVSIFETESTPPVGTTLFEDIDQSIWITYTGRGIYRKTKDEETFQKFPLGDSIASAVIYKIVVDTKDSNLLWIGTSFGLCRLDRSTKQRKWFAPSNDIPDAPSDKFTIFDQLGEDEIWLYYTYFNSLGRFDKKTGKFEQFRPPPEQHHILAGAIKDITITQDGIIWLATRFGLTTFDTKTKKFNIFTKKDGLEESVLTSIVQDKKGKLWICGNHFLSFYDPVNRTFKNYYVAKDIKRFISKSRHLSDDGTIVLGSENGIYAFHPDKVSVSEELPNIILTGFKVKNKTYLLEKEFENTTDIFLSHDENDITFEFSAIHYTNPQENQYRIKLEGFNEDWRDLGNEHKATYTNLNHGNYVFRAIASNSHGLWNEEGLSINLIITPAFWQTMWFKALIVLIFLSILYAIFKSWQHQVALKRQKEIAEQSAEYKTQFLAEVSHEIRTPMNAIIGLSNLVLDTDLDKKQHKFIKTIQQSSKGLLNIINDLLDHTKLEAGKFTFVKKPFDLFQLIDQLKDTLSHKAAEKKLNFEVKIAPNIPNEIIGDPLRLNQILTNLLGNAIKFTENGKIWLNVKKQNEHR